MVKKLRGIRALVLELISRVLCLARRRFAGTLFLNLHRDMIRAEPWHRGAAGNILRAAVLGANDGLADSYN